MSRILALITVLILTSIPLPPPGSAHSKEEGERLLVEAHELAMKGKWFANLKAGKNKLEALRLARQEICQAGYYHPFYWAPFILVGEVN